MDQLRGRLAGRISFLQVTATPYALHLQPEDYERGSASGVLYPKRPAFTELAPIHGGYVGGEDHFRSFAQ